jgi:hypothetical protein
MYDEYPDLIYEGSIHMFDDEIVIESFNIKEKFKKIFKAIKIAFEKLKEQWNKLIAKIKVNIKKLKEKIKGNKSSSSSNPTKKKPEPEKAEKEQDSTTINDTKEEKSKPKENNFGTVKYHLRDDYNDIFESMYEEFEEYVDKFIDVMKDEEADATDELFNLMYSTMEAIQGDIDDLKTVEDVKKLVLLDGDDSPHIITTQKELDTLQSIKVERLTGAINKLNALQKAITISMETVKKSIDDDSVEKEENNVKHLKGYLNTSKEVIKRFNIVINVATVISEQIQSYKPPQ